MYCWAKRCLSFDSILANSNALGVAVGICNHTAAWSSIYMQPRALYTLLQSLACFDLAVVALRTCTMCHLWESAHAFECPCINIVRCLNPRLRELLLLKGPFRKQMWSCETSVSKSSSATMIIHIKSSSNHGCHSLFLASWFTVSTRVGMPALRMANW